MKIRSKQFEQQLADYKTLLDADITSYSKQMQKQTLQDYGKNARVEIDAYLSILSRGGKRIRGALVMLGYQMCGGSDLKMILQAARAIEMIHAYILIVDDFQDRSVLRRGDKSAHVMLADYHRAHQLAGDSEHFGMSIAWNAALVGNHAAQVVLANLDVPAQFRTRVIEIVNRTMVTTGHGQTNDIVNEVSAEVTEQDVERVMDWKTAVYTILNPLQVGMVLAGASDDDIAAITPFAIHVGKAFQITDDIIGTFGNEQSLGKHPMDDMREGKRTLLTVYALQHANKADKNFMLQMLGNTRLTPAEFERCKEILIESGALANAQNQADEHISKAIKRLNQESHRWESDGVTFLAGLTDYLRNRQN